MIHILFNIFQDIIYTFIETLTLKANKDGEWSSAHKT